MKYPLENNIIEFYTYSSVSNNANISFKNQLKDVEEDLAKKIKSSYNIAFPIISELDPTKLFISITDSKSIFFRFSTKKDYEFKIEMFFDFNEEDETDIQSTLHVYHGGEKQNSYFGSISYLYSIIDKLINDECVIFNFSRSSQTFNKQLVPIFQPSLSQILNTSQF